jgi:hypothetical protein
MSIRYHPRTPRRQNGAGYTLTLIPVANRNMPILSNIYRINRNTSIGRDQKHSTLPANAPARLPPIAVEVGFVNDRGRST